MMEGCNTALETNNILMDAHFPGSTPLDHSPQSDSNQGEPSNSVSSTGLGNEIEDNM